MHIAIILVLFFAFVIGTVAAGHFWGQNGSHQDGDNCDHLRFLNDNQ